MRAATVKAVQGSDLRFQRSRHFYMTMTGEKRLDWSIAATNSVPIRVESERLPSHRVGRARVRSARYVRSRRPRTSSGAVGGDGCDMAEGQAEHASPDAHRPESRQVNLQSGCFHAEGPADRAPETEIQPARRCGQPTSLISAGFFTAFRPVQHVESIEQCILTRKTPSKEGFRRPLALISRV